MREVLVWGVPNETLNKEAWRVLRRGNPFGTHFVRQRLQDSNHPLVTPLCAIILVNSVCVMLLWPIANPRWTPVIWNHLYTRQIVVGRSVSTMFEECRYIGLNVVRILLDVKRLAPA